MGKGEIARNKHFLLFSQCFLPNQIIIFPFVHTFDFVSLVGAEFEKPKIGISGKELKVPLCLTLSQISPGFYVFAVQVF